MRSDTPRFKATENRKDGRAGSADRMARREFLMLGAAAATIGVAAVASTVEALALQPDATDDVAAGPVELPTTDEGWMALTEAQWREILSPAAFYVLREEGTERAFSHELNDEKRTGVYHCGGCDLPVYPSSTKYDSGTGWPSFYAPVSEAA
ncbi:MAG: peptide-methionine (R)-S-oxide reductase, partial [Pseudomonadota bacterium]